MRIEEGFGHKEPADLEKCTIEHVMPQKITDAWRDELGVNYTEVHEKLLHTFGNLTLSAYNAELSNQAFSDKRQRLKESHLDMNRWISERKTWDDVKILERADYLFAMARKLWPGPDRK